MLDLQELNPNKTKECHYEEVAQKIQRKTLSTKIQQDKHEQLRFSLNLSP